MLKDKLQIYLITYNRKEKLAKTFEQIFAKNSPIREFDITILDNASTDGTSELIEEYCAHFPNIKHIRHNINIGGNANICHAMELAAQCNKEYFWILCDDDTIRFRHWNEIEKAILSENYDCILVEKKVNFSSDNYPYIINTLSFLAAGIYKTENINSTVLSNAYANIMYSFPHLALGCHLLNKKSKFYVSKYRIIKQGMNPTIFYNSKDKEILLKEKNNKKKKKLKNDFIRGTNKERHFRTAHVNLFSGLVNSYQMITDKHLRDRCCGVLWIGKPFINSVIAFLFSNSLYLYNINDFYNGISFYKKFLFIIGFLLYIINKYIFGFSIRKKGVYIRLFGVLKTKILPLKH